MKPRKIWHPQIRNYFTTDESWGDWLDINKQAELQDKAKINVVVLPTKTHQKKMHVRKCHQKNRKKVQVRFSFSF